MEMNFEHTAVLNLISCLLTLKTKPSCHRWPCITHLEEGSSGGQTGPAGCKLQGIRSGLVGVRWIVMGLTSQFSAEACRFRTILVNP